jgi:protein-tyrosine phosphatase
MPVIGVQREYLKASLDEMRRSYGSIEGYLADGLHLDARVQQALRAAFAEPTAA